MGGGKNKNKAQPVAAIGVIPEQPGSASRAVQSAADDAAAEQRKKYGRSAAFILGLRGAENKTAASAANLILGY